MRMRCVFFSRIIGNSASGSLSSLFVAADCAVAGYAETVARSERMEDVADISPEYLKHVGHSCRNLIEPKNNLYIN